MASDKPKPDRSKQVPRGRYRHYKGTEYKAVGNALHSETLEPLVIYHEPGRPADLWARPIDSFTYLLESLGVPRFLFLGDHYTPEEEKERRLLSFIEWLVGMAYTEGGAFVQVRAELCQRLPQYAPHIEELLGNLRANERRDRKSFGGSAANREE